MSKFIWKNGSQVEPAKVTVDGVVYEVSPEQYEGETPLSAANLNIMVDNIYSDLQEYADNSPIKNNDYSTEEVVIGTWIDGKPLYRKTIQASVVNGLNSLATTVSNVDCLWIDLSKSFIKGTTRSNPLARVDYSTDKYSIGTVYGNDTNIIYVTLGQDNSLPGTAYITMNYTKTTD